MIQAPCLNLSGHKVIYSPLTVKEFMVFVVSFREDLLASSLALFYTQLMIPEVEFFIRVQLIKATFESLCKISVSSSGKADLPFPQC